MTFERTIDESMIRSIVCHPRVYPHISDDYSVSSREWSMPQESVWYILVKDGDEILGLWACFFENNICWKVHTCFLPSAYGNRARRAAFEFQEWIWQNTAIMRVVTDVPRYNTLALRFAFAAGMKQFGVNPKAFMKNGILHDMIMLGISRPGVETCL